MAIVNEDNNDETMVPDEFIFRSVLLVCFTTDVLPGKKLCLCIFVLGRYSVVLDIHVHVHVHLPRGEQLLNHCEHKRYLK